VERSPSNLHRFLAAAILVIMALLAGGAARHESITIDEVAHTAAGVSYLQKLDMRMNEEHPPLAKVIAAVPLVLRGAHADYSHVSWTFSERMFHQYLGEWVFGDWFLMRWNDPRTTIWWARVPMIGVMLVLGYALYAMGLRLGGPWGGLLCLACYAATPAFLAFGPLVITDIAIALFWMLTVWQLPNMWHSPSRGEVIIFGLVFAGALLSKFSSGLLVFVFVGVAMSLRLRPVPEQPTEKIARRKWRRRAGWNIVKGIGWALLFVYILYFVLSWNQPTESFSVIPKFPASPVFRRLLMPVWIYLRGLIGFAFSAGSRPTYILGHSYPHGVWFYFPVIFVLKSQLAFLLLLLLESVTAVAARRGREKGDKESLIPGGMELHWRCVWVSLVVYVVACMLNRLDISVRHFSIAIALIILMLAPLPRMLRRMQSAHPRLALAGGVLAVALVLSSIISAARAYPYFFPYINALGMGRPGYLLVNDSNLDWDQAFPDVEAFVQRQGLDHILLDRYGFSETEAYVPQGRVWNCQKASAADGGQWVVVSANNLGDTRNCLWLMRYPHQGLAGGSMYAVMLPPVIPAAGEPGGPPLPKDFHFLGAVTVGQDPRDIFVDCVRDPERLGPTFQRIMELGKQREKH
jgi:Dolichyl-phosphate-mannose-protein mannosyltransferase